MLCAGNTQAFNTPRGMSDSLYGAAAYGCSSPNLRSTADVSMHRTPSVSFACMGAGLDNVSKHQRPSHLNVADSKASLAEECEMVEWSCSGEQLIKAGANNSSDKPW